MVFKQSKRPFSDDESCQLSYKHPRQLDFTSHLASFVGTCNDIPEKPHPSGEGYSNKSQGERHANYTFTEFSVAGDKEIESSAFGSVTSLPWVTCSTSEGDPALQISYSPSLFEHDHPSRALMQSDEIYSSLFEYCPRKLVSVGPDHQADVPLWGLDGTNNSCSSCMVDGDNGEKFMGTCIIPMPDADSSDGGKVGHGRTDCSCLDEDSVRCVRQHVIEAREKLRLLFGKERFMELGFCDMGEDVAGKWSEEEEQVFHEVVFSNPVSLGLNFWEHLSLVFPSKTKKDLFSYYFNVFMLRKRAEQNRSDPMNVDSDNDEWQGSEEDSDNGEWQGSENDEFAMSGDDGDSPVESLVDQGGIYNNDIHEEDYNDDEDGYNSYDNNDDISESHFNQKPSLGKPFDSAHPITQPSGNNNSQNGSEDQDIQDDSCTSYESQHNVADSYGPAHVAVMQESLIEKNHKHMHNKYINDSLEGVVDQGYTLEPCDAKFWDVRFFTGPKKDVDFLPTCNVIEEVFGEEALNNESRNDLSIS
ncbi:uncharacterized protein LOC143856926 isoform X2 [Tasmannia lanceolata]|uniref:uncharacterized protein LOC143856926 isoform X2 n=1 Tax=Tasmannia lanceolata TaxID=3420 RepID=UPI004064C426